MNLCMISSGIPASGLLLGESLGPGPCLFCRLLQGWCREGHTISLLENLLPENNTHVILTVLTSIGNININYYFALQCRNMSEVKCSTKTDYIESLITNGHKYVEAMLMNG